MDKTKSDKNQAAENETNIFNPSSPAPVDNTFKNSQSTPSRLNEIGIIDSFGGEETTPVRIEMRTSANPTPVKNIQIENQSLTNTPASKSRSNFSTSYKVEPKVELICSESTQQLLD